MIRRRYRFLTAAAIVLALFFAILAIRALSLKSLQIESTEVPVQADTSRIAEHLSEAIRFRTVSTEDGSIERAEFLRFHEWLSNSYPRVHGALNRETVSDLSLLYTWPGTDRSLRPVVLLAHMDVVPAAAGWKYPAFEGRIVGGEIWGRGAFDDKASLVAIMEAVESLLARGFMPRRTVYVAFGHDEEAGGTRGARVTAGLLAQRGVKAELVLDEGGAITEGLVQGVTGPLASVAVAEKGIANIELNVSAAEGHSSAPAQETAIGILSRAISGIEKNPMPARLAAPVRGTLEYLAPEAPFTRRLLMANLWASEPLLLRLMQETPTGSAQVRTTCVATIVQAGDKSNVIPGSARAVLNCRILPGDTIASVIGRLQRVIADGRVEVKAPNTEARSPPVSAFDTPAALLLKRAIAAAFHDTPIAPIMTTGATDARHYASLSDSIYRFIPFTATPETFRIIHGTDERVRVEDCRRAVQFYAQFLSIAAR